MITENTNYSLTKNVSLCIIVVLNYTIVDGGWSDWSIKDCTKSCGIGEEIRQRYCNNPEPKNGGTTCQGPSFQSTLCSTQDCPEGIFNDYKSLNT